MVESTTPSSAKSSSLDVIDISDDELDISNNVSPDRQVSGNISLAIEYFAGENGKHLDNNPVQNNENLDFCEDVLFDASTKRKRTCNVVMSESESDHADDEEDDDVNNSLTSSNLDEEVDKVNAIRMPRKHCLKRLRKIASKNQDDETILGRCDKVKYQQSIPNIVANDGGGSHDDDGDDDDMLISQVIRMKEANKGGPKRLRKCLRKRHVGETHSCIPTNDDAHDDDESIEDLSQSEEGNLNGFIVDDFDVSNCEVTCNKSQDGCNGDVDSNSNNSQDSQDQSKHSDSHDVSDEDMNFSKILSKIQRKKKHEIMWEFEADMLAELGKDPVLCMKAVCALYRQQTDDEQAVKGTLHRNGHGFNFHDADRGSDLADFLTDGNPYDDIKKTVEELEEFDPEGVEVCRSLALRYSKQLYEIFKNNEDPFFP